MKADVVVIGGGGSGLAAAIEAARLGRSVILLEKGAQLGGTTSWSVGSISANCTPHQIRAGIKDSPQEHFEDMALVAQARRPGAVDNLELRRLYVENITDTFRWLMDAGIEFFGPHEEKPHRYPRMHNVLPNRQAHPGPLRCRVLRPGWRPSGRTRPSHRLGVRFRKARGKVRGFRSLRLSFTERIVMKKPVIACALVLASSAFAQDAPPVPKMFQGVQGQKGQWQMEMLEGGGRAKGMTMSICTDNLMRFPASKDAKGAQRPESKCRHRLLKDTADEAVMESVCPERKSTVTMKRESAKSMLMTLSSTGERGPQEMKMRYTNLGPCREGQG